MKPRLMNLATPLGLLCMLCLLGALAGCAARSVSAPPAPAAPLSATPLAGAEFFPSPTLQPTPLSGGSELAGSPVDAPPATESPLSKESRPALLAGEPAREFQRGGASWYGPGFHGRRTASGERFDMHALTAAHRTLPFGTLVRVHSLVNGRDVDVRITDRGPFSRGRVIDVSRAAAQELGMLGMGFKEVVLLIPESTQPLAEAWPATVKKHPRTSRHLPPPKPR